MIATLLKKYWKELAGIFAAFASVLGLYLKGRSDQAQKDSLKTVKKDFLEAVKIIEQGKKDEKTIEDNHIVANDILSDGSFVK